MKPAFVRAVRTEDRFAAAAFAVFFAAAAFTCRTGFGGFGVVGAVAVVVGAVVVAGAVVVVAAVVVAGVVATGVAQLGFVIVSVSSVTAPFRASTRPSTVTPVVTVMLVKARIVPRNVEPVPSVAELPTCQKTLQDWAPLIRLTVLADAVVSEEPA